MTTNGRIIEGIIARPYFHPLSDQARNVVPQKRIATSKNEENGGDERSSFNDSHRRSGFGDKNAKPRRHRAFVRRACVALSFSRDPPSLRGIAREKLASGVSEPPAYARY